MIENKGGCVDTAAKPGAYPVNVTVPDVGVSASPTETTSPVNTIAPDPGEEETFPAPGAKPVKTVEP